MLIIKVRTFTYKIYKGEEEKIMIIRPLDKTLAQSGVLNAQFNYSLIQRIFSFKLRNCNFCRKLIRFSFFYSMPLKTAIKYNFGGCPNYVHCTDCHDQSMREQRYCGACHITWASLPNLIGAFGRMIL